VLSIAGWVGAVVVTLYVFPDARPYLRQYVENEWIADGATAAAIFVVSLIVFSIVSHAIARMVKGSSMNAVDRSLGFVFGLVRGAVLVCLAYLLLIWIFPPESRPPWLDQARMRPWVETGASFLISLVPEETLASTLREADRVRGEVQRQGTGIDLLPSLPASPEAAPAPAPAPTVAPVAPTKPAATPATPAPATDGGAPSSG
jgi:membrane protein required for colicin V production